MDYQSMYGMQATPFGFRPNGQMQQQNPYQMQQQNPYGQMQQQGFIRVNGIEGAKRYEMGPNSAIPLFDENEDVFYVKTTDGAGFPTLRRFRFVEESAQPQPQHDYVTRQEFNETLQQLKEVILNGQQPVQQPATATEPSVEPGAIGSEDV